MIEVGSGFALEGMRRLRSVVVVDNLEAARQRDLWGVRGVRDGIRGSAQVAWRHVRMLCCPDSEPRCDTRVSSCAYTAWDSPSGQLLELRALPSLSGFCTDGRRLAAEEMMCALAWSL